MSNAIDRLEEMEGRARNGPVHVSTEIAREAGRPPITRHEVYRSIGLYGHIGTHKDIADAELHAALRNAAKPLLAVVRAGERVIATKTCDCKDHAPYHIQGCPIAAAEEALRLALATLKETTL